MKQQRSIALRLLCAMAFLALFDRSLLADENENRARATLRRMESLGTAIEAYRSRHDELPKAASIDALLPLLKTVYFQELVPRDGWETPFRYVPTGARSFQLVSAGSDRIFDPKSWMIAAQTDDLSADSVYLSKGPSGSGSFIRTWTSLGSPLLRSSEELQALAQPLVDSELEKMKGMTDVQSRNYLRTSATQRDLEAVGIILRAWRMKYGRYPAAKSMAELERMLFPEFISQLPTKDKWGTELRYVASKDGQSYRLISAGADAMFDEASWAKRGKLAVADDDAVLENGELIREWTVETQLGLGPRAKLQPKARELLAQADARIEAADPAGALNAYIAAVKADRQVADLDAIRQYARGEALAPHIAALRQFLELHPGDRNAEGELGGILPPAEAVAFASELVKARPRDPEMYRMRSQARFRGEQYLEGLADLDQATTLDPQNAELFYILGVGAYEIASKHTPDPQQKRALIRRGLAAFERAESLRADYSESMIYRQLLLREQAKLETDPAVQRKLTEEADAVRQRAVEAMKARRGKQ
jgi:hypothetical protein